MSSVKSDFPGNTTALLFYANRKAAFSPVIVEKNVDKLGVAVHHHSSTERLVMSPQGHFAAH